MDSLKKLLSIYDETELAILYDWLEWPRPAPLEGINRPIQDDDDADEGGPVRLVRSAGGYLDQNALSNAVARIVLTGIQYRLPQWSAVRADGQVQYARAYRPARHAPVELLPQHLFQLRGYIENTSSITNDKEGQISAVRSQSILAGVFLSSIVAVTSSFAAPGNSNGQGGWEPSADHVESVVIAIKSDPLSDPEPACVALQIGINLLSDTIMPPAAGVPVVPADEVILFPTLAGVEVVNPNNGIPGGSPDDPLNEADCLSVTPDGNPTFVSLNYLLQRFDSLGGTGCDLSALQSDPLSERHPELWNRWERGGDPLLVLEC
jgi:hypothetical protein